jgi:hypothetical protein
MSNLTISSPFGFRSLNYYRVCALGLFRRTQQLFFQKIQFTSYQNDSDSSVQNIIRKYEFPQERFCQLQFGNRPLYLMGDMHDKTQFQKALSEFTYQASLERCALFRSDIVAEEPFQTDLLESSCVQKGNSKDIGFNFGLERLDFFFASTFALEQKQLYEHRDPQLAAQSVVSRLLAFDALALPWKEFYKNVQAANSSDSTSLINHTELFGEILTAKQYREAFLLMQDIDKIFKEFDATFCNLSAIEEIFSNMRYLNDLNKWQLVVKGLAVHSFLYVHKKNPFSAELCDAFAKKIVDPENRLSLDHYLNTWDIASRNELFVDRLCEVKKQIPKRHAIVLQVGAHRLEDMKTLLTRINEQSPFTSHLPVNWLPSLSTLKSYRAAKQINL